MIDTQPLHSVAELVRGVTFSKSEALEMPQEGYSPVLRAGNISDNLNIDGNLVFVDEARITKKQRLKPNDIVVCTSSGSASVLGKSAILEREWNGSFGAFLAVVRTNERLAFPHYIAHYLRSPAFRRWASNSSGIGIKNIRASDLKEVPIPLPPLEEQKRIAAILDQADRLRGLRQRAIDKLSVLSQSLFFEMFGDQLKDEVWQPLGPHMSKVGSGATPKGGEAAYKSSGISLIRSMNVRDGEFSGKGLAFIDDQQAEKLKNVVVEENDVLLNITGASVARVCIVPKRVLPARVNQHVSIIRPKDTILPEFLEVFLLFPTTKKKLINIAESGATRQAITKTEIEELQIPIFPIGDQQKFVSKRARANSQVELYSRQLRSFGNLFSSLQQRAFRGEL